MGVIKSGVNERALLTALPAIFSSSLTWVCELAQNARRAGATAVLFGIENKENELKVIVEDDGCGIDDPSVLLNLGTSGWDEVTQLTETPFGMGFLAAVMSASVVTVQSRFGTVVITKSDLISQRNVEVQPHSWAADAGTRVELLFRGADWTEFLSERTRSEIRNRLDGFGIPVILDGEDITADKNVRVKELFHYNDMTLGVTSLGCEFFRTAHRGYSNHVRVYVQGILTDERVSSHFKLGRLELGDSYIPQFPDRMHVVDFNSAVLPKIQETLSAFTTYQLKVATKEILSETTAAQATFVELLHLSGIKPPPELERLGIPGSMLSHPTTVRSDECDDIHSLDAVRDNYDGFKLPVGERVVFGIHDVCESFGFLRDVVAAFLVESGVIKLSSRVARDSEIAEYASRQEAELRKQLGVDTDKESDRESEERAKPERFYGDEDTLFVSAFAQEESPKRVLSYRTLSVELGDSLAVHVNLSGHRRKRSTVVFTNAVHGTFRTQRRRTEFSLQDRHVLAICMCGRQFCDGSNDHPHDALVVIPGDAPIRDTLLALPSSTLWNLAASVTSFTLDYRDSDSIVNEEVRDNDSARIVAALHKELGLDMTDVIREGILSGMPLGLLLEDREVSHELVVVKDQNTYIGDIRVTYRRS